MVDYYAALKQTVARLEAGDGSARSAFYDRARRLVLERLRSTDPPMAEADIRQEMAALEGAIARIQDEVDPPSVPDTSSASDQPDVTDGQLTGSANEAANTWFKKPTFLSRPVGIALGGAVALIIGVIGYANWGRQNGHADRASERPIAAPSLPAAQSAKTGGLTLVSVDDLPYSLRRQLVYYRTSHPAGTIVIEKSQHFLYLVKPNLAALRYAIGVGTDCLDSAGLFSITRASGSVNSSSTSASQDSRQAQPAADSGNLDARTINLESTKYRIRPIDRPSVIGQDSPLPGFLLLKGDFADLYDRSALSTRVVVMN